jgi:predicted ATPase/DNA-binding SARP family transcriptional activator
MPEESGGGSGPPAVAGLRIGILGPLLVERDDRRVEVAGGRLKALLARLAIDVGRPVSATSLADAIWDGELPADELHALQSLVSRLRRTLGGGELIEQSAGGYRLVLAAEGVDASRFAGLVAEGARWLREGDPERAVAALSEALALWRGPALGDLVAVGALALAATGLEDLRTAARADRVEGEMALGRAAEMVPELEALAGEHPLHERVAGQLIQALYAAGRQADALTAYERVRARLADELGVTPSPELAQIHLAVLQGEQPVVARVGRETRSNVAVRLTSFVGRERELEQVGKLLHEHRLLTLVGAGGAGKTRLASEVADRVVRSVRDGVWLVELAPVADGAGIVPAVLGSLGLREVRLLGTGSTVGAGDALSHVVEVLADKQTLLVLDNCEHLLEPVAREVDRLLGACPGLRIMCTSREPLGITGEMIVSIAPLELPAGELSPAEALAVPAVALFADRAATAAAGFAVDEHTVAAVVEVCRRVDGLPLAIELAAARLRSMTLPQLAARLDDRFRLLTGGSRTAMARHRTLRAVVDWSWDLLDERERALLSRLSVFEGGASLEAAEAVCAGGAVGAAEVFDLLCALVDKSLLQMTDSHGPRYRMLETIREYGLERLAEADELRATRTAHAHHFARLAIEAAPHLRAADQLAWLARLRAEYDNVLAALRYLGETGEVARAAEAVVALLWFWVLSGSRQEVLTWTDFVHGLSGEADRLDRVLIDGVRALARAIPGDPGSGNPWDAVTTTLAQIEDLDLAEYPLLAALRPLLGMAVGRERILGLLEHSARHPDPWVRATVPFVRVQLSENDGDVEGMGAALDEALRAFGQVGDRWGLATTLSELSSLRILHGDLDGAEQALEQTRSLMGELGASDGGATMRLRLADVRARRGDLAGARRTLLESLDERERFAEETAMIKISLAYLFARDGEIARARELSDEVCEHLSRSERPQPAQGHTEAIALNGTALIEIEAGAPDVAHRVLTDAYPVAQATRDMPIVATLGVTLAALEHSRGHHTESAEILGAAAGLRGAEDRTHPEVARLTTALRGQLGDEDFDAEFERGRALGRDDALARLDPGRLGELDASAVCPQGQGNEHHQQDPHPEERPQHV